MLIPPRQLNPDISPHTERALLWAMSLHPDERPQDVETFRKAIIGDQPAVTVNRRKAQPAALDELVGQPMERILLFVSVGLMILTLFLTIFR
jgi:serine/threonine-protein kinase